MLSGLLSGVLSLLGCGVASLLNCGVASLLGCGIASLLGCGVASLLGCGVASLLGCGVASHAPGKLKFSVFESVFSSLSHGVEDRNGDKFKGVYVPSIVFSFLLLISSRVSSYRPLQADNS